MNSTLCDLLGGQISNEANCLLRNGSTVLLEVNTNSENDKGFKTNMLAHYIVGPICILTACAFLYFQYQKRMRDRRMTLPETVAPQQIPTSTVRHHPGSDVKSHYSQEVAELPPPPQYSDVTRYSNDTRGFLRKASF